MRARVHTVGESGGLATGLSLMAVVGVLGILSKTIELNFEERYLWLACVVAFGCVVPSLTWRARGALHTVETDPGFVRFDGQFIDARAVTGFSAVEGERGWSVAATAHERTTVFEVARRTDAERIAKSLGRTWPRDGVVTFERPSTGMRVVQTTLSLSGVLCAWMYWLCATGRAGFSDGKPLFGLSMLAIGVIGLVVFVRRMRHRGGIAIAPRGVDSFGRVVTAADAYPRDGNRPERMTLKTDAGTETIHGTANQSEVDDHLLAHVRDALGSQPLVHRHTDARLDKVLSDGSENVRDWLARLDAWSREEAVGGYRGTLPTQEELWRVFRDETAMIEARLAAGRLLRLRYSEAPDAMIDAIGDRALRVRVRVAVTDSVDDAAEELDRLGPMFRVRAAPQGRIAAERPDDEHR